MTQDKSILFTTEDFHLSSQLKELSSQSGYHVTSSTLFKDSEEDDLIFCDYLLLPEAVFTDDFTFKSDVFVLFDMFEEQSIIKVLNRGASGYLLRPITAKVLDAVIQSFLRYHNTLAHSIPESISFGDCIFHVFHSTIESSKGKVHLTPSEAGILKRLLMNRGHLCLRKHLLGEIKSNAKEIVARNVDVHIASLRKKLGPYGSKIATVRGVGYLFAKNDYIDDPAE